MVFAPASQYFFDEVAASYPSQFTLYVGTFLGLVPEEKHALCQFLTLTFRTEYWFQSVWVVAGVPHLGADGHWGGGEILYLLQLKIQPFGDEGQLCHIFLCAAGMAADEIGDNLLAEPVLLVDAVEDFLELLKLFERWLAHEV